MTTFFDDMKTPKKPTGPEPERVKIEGNWADAVGIALRKAPQPKVKPASKSKRKRKG